MERLPRDIVMIIAAYHGPQLDPLWAPGRPIDWMLLSKNPGAIEYLRAHPDEVNNHSLSGNPAAAAWLMEEPWRIVREVAYAMPEMAPWIREDIKRFRGHSGHYFTAPYVRWGDDVIRQALFRNPAMKDDFINCGDVTASDMVFNPDPEMFAHAVPDAKNAPRGIWFRCEDLSRNPAALECLTHNPHLIRWEVLSSQPWAMPLIRVHLSQACWYGLSKNPAAIDEIRAAPHMMILEAVAANPAAMDIIRAYPDHVSYNFLLNPAAVMTVSAVFDMLMAVGTGDGRMSADLGM
jgi:hypothetical protein